MYGDGKELRDFLFSDDLGPILHSVIDSNQSFTVNIATGKSVNLLNLIELIEEITGESLDLLRKPRVKPKINYQFNNAKMRKLINYDLITPINLGLHKLMAS